MNKLVLLVVLLFSCAALSQRAHVEILSKADTSLTAIDAKKDIEQIKDGNAVPDGYKEVARGEFKTGPATLKCGERFMIESTEKKAREIGADAFRFYEVKEPNMILNTCYKAKILFLKKVLTGELPR